jgi:hypothetical protein
MSDTVYYSITVPYIFIIVLPYRALYFYYRIVLHYYSIDYLQGIHYLVPVLMELKYQYLFVSNAL